MDICSVIGTENGLKVLALASALLDSSSHLRLHFADPMQVINKLNGATKDPSAFAQPRHPGVDLLRLVRRPIFRLMSGDECFEAAFVSALIKIAGGKEMFSSYSSEQSCCLVVYKHADAYTENIKDHASRAYPAPISKEKDKWVLYLTPIQMFTFLVLLIHTTAIRESFKMDAKREIYAGDGSWMVQHTILTSTRVSLLPFIQWLQVRGDPRVFKATPDHPQPSEINYIPTIEDGCTLNKCERLPDIGRIFGSLIPLELVNWVIHQKDGGHFAIHKSFYECRTQPKIAAIPADLMAVVFYYFYQLSLRDIAANYATETMQLHSFPQFINLAVSVLSRDDWVSAVKYPRAIKTQLKAMRGSLTSGKVGGGDRAVLAMFQMAVVFREREPVGLPPRIRYHRWDYSPVQTFTRHHLALLRPHCSPSVPVGEFGAILIQNTSAALLKSMVKRFIDGGFENPVHGVEMHFLDFVHTEYTNSEVAALVLVPDHELQTGLQALQIYLRASAAMANPETKIDTTQQTIGFLGALLAGGPLLFHWLNFFPRCLVPPKERAAAPAQKLDLDLNSSSDDEAEEKESEQEANTAEAFLYNAVPVSTRAWKHINILCEPGFVSTLLKEAIKEDERATDTETTRLQQKMDKRRAEANSPPVKVSRINKHQIFKDTLMRIVMMCSNRICMFADGFKNMGSLNNKFYGDMLYNSPTFQGWGLLRRSTVIESINQPRAATESWFTEPPYQTDGPGLFDDSEKDGPPSLTLLGDELVLDIMRDIEADLKSLGNGLRGLRKFSQLVPISRLLPRQIGVYFPWLGFPENPTAVLTPRDVHWEHMHPSTVGHLQPVAPRALDKEDDQIVEVFGSVCGVQFKNIPAEAIASQRLFLIGRTSAEVILPVDLRLNIFRTDLARIGSQLVGQMMFEPASRTVDGKTFFDVLVREAGRITNERERFIKEKTDRKRPKLDHPAPAPAAAAAASSSSKRAATSAASAVYADDSYSPGHPGYASPSKAYYPPSDEWKNDGDFTARLEGSASQMDPMAYASPERSNGKKKRAGHP